MAKLKWDLNTIRDWAKENRPDYMVLEQKTENKQNKIRIKCSNEAHPEVWMLTSSFMKGNLCQLCGFEKISCNKIKWTDSKLESFIKDKLNMIILNIKREDKYIELILKDIHKYQYQARLTNILHNKELCIVHKNNPYSLENIKIWLKINNKNFTLCSDTYINEKSRLKWKCLKCNKYFYTSWGCVRMGQECTNCNKKYKGEECVKDFLIKNNIDYIPQYTFNDCRGKKKPLQFDFAILDNENNLTHIIEYDGKQHFKPVNFGGVSDKIAEENLIIVKVSDNIKNNYCKNNNIPLLRISYKDYDNIEEILSRELNLTSQVSA